MYASVDPDDLLIRYDLGIYTDSPTLDVKREMFGEGEISSHTVESFVGDEAFAIYNLLIGETTLDSLTKGSSDLDNKKIEDVIFHLKCIRDYLLFVSKEANISTDYGVYLVNDCISKLEEE